MIVHWRRCCGCCGCSGNMCGHHHLAIYGSKTTWLKARIVARTTPGTVWTANSRMVWYETCRWMFQLSGKCRWSIHFRTIRFVLRFTSKMMMMMIMMMRRRWWMRCRWNVWRTFRFTCTPYTGWIDIDQFIASTCCMAMIGWIWCRWWWRWRWSRRRWRWRWCC